MITFELMLIIIAILCVILSAILSVSYYMLLAEKRRERANAINRLLNDVRFSTDLKAKSRFKKGLWLLVKSDSVKKRTFAKAAMIFMKVAQRTSDELDKAYALGWVGRCYEDYGNEVVAATCYAAASGVAPSDTYASERLGDFFWKADSEESLKRYEQVVEYDPVSARVYYKLGKLHSMLGESQKAIERYQTAIQVHNGYVASMAEAAIECAKIGDKANVLRFYLLAIANDLCEFEKLEETLEEMLSQEVLP